MQLASIRVATTAEKLTGGLGPNTGALAPRARPEAALGVSAGGGRPFSLWGSGDITPGKFLKTLMLNPVFWWLLCSLVGSQGRPSKQVETTTMSISTKMSAECGVIDVE